MNKLGVLVTLSVFGGSATAAPGDFNPALLKSLGIDASVAEVFKDKTQFPPGVQSVDVGVNGRRPQNLLVQFDFAGQPCFSSANLTALGLLEPSRSATKLDANPSTQCFYLPNHYPEMRQALYPNSGKIDLLVPDRARSVAETSAQKGGTAASLGYNMVAWRSQGSGDSSLVLSGSFVSGINISNWVVRSNSTYYRDTRSGFSQFQQQETYVQRAIEPWHAMLQAGQIGLQSQAYAGVPIYGVQIFSDTAQTPTGRLLVPLRGIANSNALIEIRQGGQLIYQTVVAPGAFSLTDIPRLRPGADITMTVTEENGQRQTTVASGSQGLSSAPQSGTYSLSVGKYRYGSGQDIDKGRSPWVMAADYNYSPSEHLSLTPALLMSSVYQGVASDLSLNYEDFNIGAGVRTSRSEGKTGGQFNLNAYTQIGNAWSIGSYANINTYNYVDPQATFIDPTWFDNESLIDRNRYGVGLSLAYRHSYLGSISVSSNWNQDFNGVTNQGHSVSYTKTYKRNQLNLTWTHNPGSYDPNQVYLSISIPLQGGRLATQYTRISKQDQGSLMYSNSIAGGPAYSLRTSYAPQNRQVSGSLSQTTPYTAVSVGASTSSGSRSRHSVNASLNGGVVLSGEGVSFSSQAPGDTFAIVRYVDASGLAVQTPSGRVKTDWRGMALVPRVQPYQDSQISVEGKSIPPGLRLSSTATPMSLAYGSVAVLSIPTQVVNQLMLTIYGADGEPVPSGTLVQTVDGNYLGITVGGGLFVLENAQIGVPIRVRSATTKVWCDALYTAPPADVNVPYQRTQARCAVLDKE